MRAAIGANLARLAHLDPDGLESATTEVRYPVGLCAQLTHPTPEHLLTGTTGQQKWTVTAE
jgi:hypothetical protein